jgi:acyl dehydratase
VPFNPDLVGKRYPDVRLTLTRDMVTAFAEAIAERNPVFLDPAAAKQEGFPEQVAPPTILARLQIEAVREITSDPLVGAEFDGIVHSEQVYAWERPAVVGDELVTTPFIADVRAKGSISFMDVELDVLDAAGDLVVRSVSTLVEIGGER